MQPHPVALLLNDIHIGKDTIQDFKLNWEEAMNIAIDNQIRHIIIGGDLFLSRSSQNLDILLAVHDALRDCKLYNIIVTMIEGNHDLVDQEATRGYCHVFDSFSNVMVVDDVCCLELGNVTLGMISYFPENGSFAKKHEMFDELFALNQQDSLRMLYIHQGIQGALSQPTESDLPASMFSKWDKVFVGHYHDRTKFDNIEYIGASRQHNFGEDEEKGYTILYSNGSTEFVKNQINVRYKTLEIDFDTYKKKPASIKDKIEEYVSEKEVPYKVRVKIHCDQEQAKKIDKKLLYEAGASKVEVDQANIEATSGAQHDFEKKFDKNDLTNLYKSYCKEYNKSEDEYNLGIKYLKEIK